MPILADLRALNVEGAEVALWTVRGPRGAANAVPIYSGRWVETTDGVDEALKATLSSDLERIEEVLDYGLLAQNNEASALLVQADETHLAHLLEEIVAETVLKKAVQVRHLQNAKFYVAKFIVGQQIAYGIRKTDPTWKTRKARSVRNVFFQDERLAIDDRPHFELSRTFDFIVLGGEILILNKRAFESILRHKAAQREDFQELQAEAEFHAIFVNVAPLVGYIGDNKIQLRRACAIRAKGHYRDEAFMERLRETHAEYGFALQFDDDGKIIATPETCADIMKALLDHRLRSGFSTLIYDVQDTTPVNI
ncbi:Kiwa anti-phage protein KwaB-like domain-containing protein [Allomesorhizobium camelthorni]|uniref:DUF4868 domain-containing protein n=1 Tax=Allomesorhizobium camelthorni TaxID=475069 RepID=A0A6G4WJY3_9HYPH|nr:Kiwa anti-phage protein KwaB-like domain-containing protein [Mesorhizobium camelthorni]NGO54536.1 DUF4868 domain-containing protein [Mesorhizobium camelthorni]